MAAGQPDQRAAGRSAVASATRRREIYAVLLLAAISYALAQTLIVPAIPEIVADFGASPEAASWLITAFLLSASIATPIAGKLGDVYGNGRVLAALMLVFTAGGVVAALSNSIGPMIGGRVLQGVSSGVYPLAFAIVKENFPTDKVAGGLSMVSALTGIGAALGLVLSGLIIDGLGIPWLFWVSLLGIPAAILSDRMIPSERAKEGVKIDWLGAILLALALGCLLLAITRANAWGWGSPRTLALALAGLGVLAIWLRVESRRRQPLIELRLLRLRSVAATNLSTLLIGFVVYVSFLLVPQFAHTPTATGYGPGLSIIAAGLVVLPLGLVQVGAAPLAARVGSRAGFRTTLILGGAMATVSLTLLVFVHDWIAGLVLAIALTGAGVAFNFAAAANLVVDSVPAGDVGIATAINAVTRVVGGAFGAAVATALLAADPQALTGFPSEGAYTLAFAVAAGVGLLATLAATLVPPRALRR